MNNDNNTDHTNNNHTNNNYTHTNNNIDGEDLLERTRIILENETIMDDVSFIGVANYPSLNYFTDSSYLYSLVYSTVIASMVLVYSLVFVLYY